jgi:hypothetical protein
VLEAYPLKTRINGKKERLQREYKNPPGALVSAPSGNFFSYAPPED